MPVLSPAPVCTANFRFTLSLSKDPHPWSSLQDPLPVLPDARADQQATLQLRAEVSISLLASLTTLLLLCATRT